MRSLKLSGCKQNVVAWLIAAVLCVCGGAARAQDTPIPATAAITTAGCNAHDLGDGSDSARNDPIWTPILNSSSYHFGANELVTILEGRVIGNNEKFKSRTYLPVETTVDQSPSEVAEEDLPWNHYTHDKTLDVVPDPGYKRLLSSYLLADGTSQTHESMEVEWENGSKMIEDNGASDRTWGGLPEFAWASAGDRVWIVGRWIFDCGHPGSSDSSQVEFSTEIHPPRAMVVFRLNHQVEQVPGVHGDWPPVSGGDTALPVTEADIFVSGNGGGANDICSITNRHISETTDSVDDCSQTSPVIAVNTPNFATSNGTEVTSVVPGNYVFDIYPPGTNFDPSQKAANGTYPVTPPSLTASLQWKTINQLGHSVIPEHSCGASFSDCITVSPILCLIDATTPAPTEAEPTSCPAVPASPTRLRVILPFRGTSANVFAQTILLGWDDVPQNANQSYVIKLHKFTVLKDGEVGHDGDWRVFADVGGQWRYLSNLFDMKSDGTSECNGADSLVNNGDDDCFYFDRHPWYVSVPPGMKIHVAVGGFESDDVDSKFCFAEDNYFNGGNCDLSLLAGFALLASNDDRLGNLEFDLDPSDGYQRSVAGSLTGYDSEPHPNALGFQTGKLDDVCSAIRDTFPQESKKDCGIDGTKYQAEFTVAAVSPLVVPSSSALKIGTPTYTNTNTLTTYVGGSTPLSLSTTSTSNVGFQSRFVPDSGPLPTFDSTLPFPLHWQWTDFAAGPRTDVPLLGFAGDGGYNVQYSAVSAGCGDPLLCGITEPRNSVHLVLDTTPPVITISQPAATQYPHSATLTLGYTVTDAGSGVASFTPSMDGSLALPNGQSLGNGQMIKLLMSGLSLWPHLFGITAADNIGNSGSRAVTFTIVVTPESIKDDVTQFLAAGKIKNAGEANSLLAKLDAAAKSWAAGKCSTANNQYQAFINELNAQSGKGVDATAAQIMIADAIYLMTHCPS